jgi:CRISPR-associated protein Cas2
MLILVSYDIVDDRRRTRLAHTLKDFGRRVQYSVFECSLEEAQVERMEAKIARLIEPAEDRVRIYRLCVACRARVVLLGQGELTTDPDFYLI